MLNIQEIKKVKKLEKVMKSNRLIYLIFFTVVVNYNCINKEQKQIRSSEREYILKSLKTDVVDTLDLGVKKSLADFFAENNQLFQAFIKKDYQINYTTTINSGNEMKKYIINDEVVIKNTYDGKKNKYHFYFQNKLQIVKKLDDFPDFDNFSIDYLNSSFYEANNRRLILIVSQPSEYTGIMSNFSLYQLWDVLNKTIYCFNEFGDSPKILDSTYDNGDFVITFITADNSPSEENWNLYLRKILIKKRGDTKVLLVQTYKGKKAKVIKLKVN